MSPRTSAGILLYRHRPGGGGASVELLIVHPGGPFWRNKDDGAWSLPKGEYSEEEPLACAIRELGEELGPAAPQLEPGDLQDLGEVRQAGGKLVAGWAAEADFDVDLLESNEFEARWPPRSDSTRSFPEVDRAEWVDPETARRKLNPAQAAFVDRLLAEIGEPGGGGR